MKSVAILLIFAAVAALTSLSIAAPPKPNILFIAVDDLRLELGCYGVKEIHSPNIDKLAASAVTFNRAYCQQAVCNPSRVSLMTGLRPDSTKVWYLDTEMRSVIPDVVTIPQHFRKHGYRALGFGKIFHNPWPDNVSWDEPHRWPESAELWSDRAKDGLAKFREKMRADGKTDAAIDRIRAVATEVVDVPDVEHFDGAIGEQAIEAMRKLAAGDQPFFLAAGFIRPHLPFVVPRKYWDLYDRSKISLATNPFLPRGAPPMSFGEARFQGGFYELRDYMDYSEARWPSAGPLEESYQRELKHGYYASVSFTDALVGRLLDELDRLGLARNTVVVLWGDHGWKLGEHGGWCKQTNYEIDTRAPLIIRSPEAKGNGRHSDALVEFVDVYPTLCDLAGIPIPQVLEGSSLAPLLADPSATVKKAAFSQFPRKLDDRNYMGYAMRTDRYRYIEWLDSERGAIAAQELYDHAIDPDENENLAVQEGKAALLESLSRQLWDTLPKPVFPFRFARTTPSPVPLDSQPALTWHMEDGEPLPVSKPAGEFVNLTFVNERPEPAEVVWIVPDGTRKSYRTLEKEGTFSIRTRPGALWVIQDTQGKRLGYFVVEPKPGNLAKAVIPEP
ncbi:MAG: sulfatase-like hydrolase/transferase [Verrucomicrobiae bacterium]|nr:sulfatase-like hydrolase/transferase [Verrucomicrobiae bacterium]